MKNRNDLKENLDLANKFFKNKNFEKAENLYKKITFSAVFLYFF